MHDHPREDRHFLISCSATSSTTSVQAIETTTEIDDLLPRTLDTLSEQKRWWWMHMTEPSNAELENVLTVLHVPKILKDVVFARQRRERVEFFNQSCLLCLAQFRTPHQPKGIHRSPFIYVILQVHCLITISTTFSTHITEVRHRLLSANNGHQPRSADVCCSLMSSIIHSIRLAIREAEIHVDCLDEEVVTLRNSNVGALVEKIGLCRSRVKVISRQLSQKAEIGRKLLRGMVENSAILQTSTGPDVQDVKHFVETLMGDLVLIESSLRQINTVYTAQLTLAAGVRRNNLAKMLTRITVLGIIGIPPYTLTSMFSIYVNVPGTGVQGLSMFGTIVAAISCYIIIAISIARRMNLL